jgi:hypothetical protein
VSCDGVGVVVVVVVVVLVVDAVGKQDVSYEEDGLRRQTQLLELTSLYVGLLRVVGIAY